MCKVIQVHPADTVAIALETVPPNKIVQLQGKSILLQEAIAIGHKFAITVHQVGDLIIKYGMPIGYASQKIDIGQKVHTHNVKTTLDKQISYQYTPAFSRIQNKTSQQITFQGYLRKNGDIGIRNDIAIIPLVGCVNGLIQRMIQVFNQHNELPNNSSFIPLFHSYGCSQLGSDLKATKNILQNMVKHPNYGGILVVALGCENNQINEFKTTLGEYDTERVRFLLCQEEDDEIEKGVQYLEELANRAKQDSVEEIPISKLRIGLKCGGSDGLSGITANPLVGKVSDYFVLQGATTVLTEVPEMFGAEQLLMNRTANKKIYTKLVKLITDFKEYFLSASVPVYENPSPGNKKGGITTLEDKSLGCIQKSGSAIIQDILRYEERLTTSGLNILESPGNDIIAVSALAASGCHMILFTTGRGTPLGASIPVIKIATNSHIFKKKCTWFDFNAGSLLEGTTQAELSQALIQLIIETANGKVTVNEKQAIYDFAIFKRGVTL